MSSSIRSKPLMRRSNRLLSSYDVPVRSDSLSVWSCWPPTDQALPFCTKRPRPPMFRCVVHQARVESTTRGLSSLHAQQDRSTNGCNGVGRTGMLDIILMKNLAFGQFMNISAAAAAYIVLTTDHLRHIWRGSLLGIFGWWMSSVFLVGGCDAVSCAVPNSRRHVIVDERIIRCCCR